MYTYEIDAELLTRISYLKHQSERTKNVCSFCCWMPLLMWKIIIFEWERTGESPIGMLERKSEQCEREGSLGVIEWVKIKANEVSDVSVSDLQIEWEMIFSIDEKVKCAPATWCVPGRTCNMFSHSKTNAKWTKYRCYTLPVQKKFSAISRSHIFFFIIIILSNSLCVLWLNHFISTEIQLQKYE